MDRYLQAEKQLAELRGWKDVGYQRIYDRLMAEPPNGTCKVFLPQWCLDNDPAFDLQAEQGIVPSWFNNQAIFGGMGVYRTIIVAYNEHPSKMQAIRYGIVLAAIDKLTNEQKIKEAWSPA